jgi:tRNA(Ile)-lysidine synthase
MPLIGANLFATLAPNSCWLVAVSGGADSVALLRLLRAARPDVVPIVAHLNHQTRGEASDGDADFVRTLADSLGVSCEVALRREVEQRMAGPLHDNSSARYRAARHAFFRELVSRRDLAGVLVAHHADDVAETTMLRLLRGGEPTSLAGLRAESIVNGLRIVRPLIAVRRAELETHLRAIGQSWREDASNASADYARNRVRTLLRDRPELFELLQSASMAARAYADSIAGRTPDLPPEPSLDAVADLPSPIARPALRRWLRENAQLNVERTLVDELLEMTRDRSIASRLDVGPGVSVERAKSMLRIRRDA